jgi:outer membrane protein TolC
MNSGRTSRMACLLVFAAGPLAAAPMQLSLEDAVAAALQRNFAVRIERIEPDLARAAVQAAAGAHDLAVRVEYGYRRDERAGYSRDDETASFRFGVGSLLPWGTLWEASVEANDRTTPFDTLTGGFSDAVSSFAGIVVTQPVLRGFGLDGAYAPVLLAREALTVSEEGFRVRVIDIVEATVAAYQSVWFARENLRIARHNRDLALRLLDDNRRRVASGVMAPLDLVQAESEAALREVLVISAANHLSRARNALKSLIWDDPATVLDLELEILPPREPAYFATDRARDLQLALAQRPEYRAAQAGVAMRAIEVRQARRNALPQLDLVGSAGWRGLDISRRASLEQAFGDGDAGYAVGAVFSMPFPNRGRAAERTRAYLRRNQSELAIGELEQRIRIELDDAANQLQADWERIIAARTARTLAEQSLQAEEKKLQAGTSTTFVVLRLQGDLAVAEIREINALADYAVSLAQYHRARGSLLEQYGISLR